MSPMARSPEQTDLSDPQTATGPQMLIRIEGLSKSFVKDSRRIYAIRDLDLTVQSGSFVVLLGQSGCGKSTLLNMIAGLSQPDDGVISYAGKAVLGPRTEVGYLTQHDTLMPWRDLRRNIALPLQLRGVPAAERLRAADELIGRVRLRGFEKHYPRELSGGMRRRAGLARMLCADPETLLMDEPFGALDAQLRQELQDDLLRLWHGTGKTVVFVTHDLDEALCLGDRVIVLARGGRVVLDEPIELGRPRNLDTIRLDPAFVASHQRLATALKE
jgi:NitT/TauT family transport system ATP-binding protein